MTDQPLTVAVADASPPSFVWRRWVAYGLLTAVLVVTPLVVGHNLARQQERDERANKALTPTSDFGVFYHTAERFWRGEPLYRAGLQPAAPGARQNRGDAAMGFKYGPLFAMLLTPLATVPAYRAARLWTLGNLLAIFGMGWILSRWIRRFFRLREPTGAAPPLQAPASWGWVALLGSAFFLQLNIVYGQTNLMFMFLLMAGLELYSGGRPIRGGLLAGLVAGMRLTPLVFLPYFLWKRQWRAGGGMLLGLAVSFALPAAWWGPAEFGRQMQEWRELVAADEALDSATLRAEQAAAAAADPEPAVLAPTATTAASGEDFYLRPTRYQSIPPMVLDTFAENYTPKPGERTHPYQGQRNFLRGVLDRRQALIVAYGLSALFCLACAGLCWRNYRRDDLRHPLEWALVLTAMLLVSPYTERTHFAALTPALGLIVAAALAAAQRPAAAAAAAGFAPSAKRAMLGAAALFLYFNAVNQSIVPRAAAEWFKGFHGFVIGAIAVFVTLAIWLQREHRAWGAGARAVTPTAD